MPKYVLLINGDAEAWATTGPDEKARIDEGHSRFMDAEGSAVIAGHELAGASTAVTVRSRGAERPLITDGPFAETKEIVGGFYIVDVADMDEAVRLAALLPEASATYSAGVEIRPVVELV